MTHNTPQYLANISFYYRKWSLMHYITQKVFTFLLFIQNFYLSIRILDLQDTISSLFIQLMGQKIILALFIILVTLFHCLIYIYWFFCYSKRQYIKCLSQIQLKRLATIIQIIPLIAPLILNCLYLLALFNNDWFVSIIVIILGLSTVLIWIMRIIYFRENYLNLNVKLQNKVQMIQIILFMGNIILRLCMVNILLILIWNVFWLMLLISYKFYEFTYLSQQLQYLDFIGKILYLVIVSISIIFYCNPQTNQNLLLGISLGICLTLEKFDFFKLLFELKYHRIFQNKFANIQTLIILSQLISTKFKTNNLFNFQFYTKIDQILLQIDMPQNNNVDQTKLKSPILYFLKSQNMSKNIIKKIEANKMNHYMIYWCIKNDEYLNAIRYFSQWSVEKQNFIKKYEVSLCKLELIEYVRQSQKSIRIIQQQKKFNICLLKRSSGEIQAKQIIYHENILVSIINQVTKLIQFNNQFIKKLNKQNSTKQTIKSDLIIQYQHKKKIQNFVSMNTQKFQCKEFLVVYYIYLVICCQTKYSSFSNFINYFCKIEVNLALLKKQLNLQKYMMVLVSGENQFIGRIINANVPMKNFFSLSDDKIQQKLINIDIFLPKQISNSHNAYMLNFKKKGTSKFIGISRQLVLIKNGHCVPVQIYTKIFPFMNGLAYASRLKLLKNNNFILLYNSQGIINQYTQKIFQNIRLAPKTNILEIFQNNISKRQNQKKIVKEIIYNLDYSILKLNDMIIKATFSSLNGQNYFLGFCKLCIYQNRSYRKKTQARISFKTKNLLQQSSNQNDIYNKTQFCQKKLEETQTRLGSAHQNDDLIKKYKINIAFLIIALISGLYIIQYLEHELSNKAKEYLNFYNTLSTNFVTRNYQTFNIFALRRAIEVGIISNDITSIYNITNFQKYIRNSANIFLNQTAKTEYFIDKYISKVSDDISQLITQKSIILSVSTPQINISILQAVSLQKSFFEQIFEVSNQQFQDFFNLNLYIYQYLFNQLCSSSNLIFSKIFAKINQNLESQKNIDMIVLIVILSILMILKIIHISNHTKIEKKVDYYINLLYQIQGVQFSKKYKLNCFTIQLLNNLKKSSITDISIDPYKNLISCIVGKNEYVFENCQIKFQKIFFDYQIFNFKKINKQKLHIKNKYIKISQIFLMILLVLPLSYYSYSSISFTTSINQQMKVYIQYKTQIQQLTHNLPNFLNIPLYSLINNNTNYFFLINATELIQNLTYSISHRQFQSIFENNLNWNQSKTIFYQSHCQSNDQLCPMLFSNIFNQSIPAIINKFTMQTLILTTKMQQNNLVNGSDINRQMVELQISYQQYLRPLLDIVSQYGIKITTRNLDNNQNGKNKTFLEILLPIFIISMLFMLYNVYKKQKTFKIVKKQILSCMSVDILLKNIKFSTEINRI